MKENTSFLTWIKTYPVKAVLILILFIIPLLFLILFSYTSLRNAKSFYFDKDDNDNPIILYQKDIVKRKKLDEVFDKFEINLESVENIKNKDKENIQYGRFKFNVNYETSSLYKDSDINFRYVMTANWFNEQSNTTTSTTIEFPYNLPKRKYLFFKVNKPTLYVEITIDKHFSGVEQTKKEVLYYKLNLNNVTYDNVIEN